MKKVWLLNLLFPILVMILFISAANNLITKYQKKQQILISESYLKYAVRVSAQLSAAIKDAKESKTDDCSTDSLGKLREIRSHYKYIDDIGVVKNNSIICTAVWGDPDVKYILPDSPYVTTDGYKLHLLGTDSNYMRSLQSAATLDNYIAMPSAVTFSEYKNAFPDYWVKISTEDGKRDFYISTENTAMTKNETSFFFGLNVKICDVKEQLCVETYNSKGGISSLSWPLVLVIIMLGAAFGWFASQFILMKIANRKSMENRLLKAINQEKIYMMYQPVIRSGDGALISLESLARWHDDIFGNVSPETFINLSEKMRLYPKLSRIIVNKTFDDLHLYLIQNQSLMFSLNITDVDLTDARYLSYLLNKCRVTGVNPNQIKLEITERCTSGYTEIASFCLDAKKHGMTVSLDDFGTGHSNIAWLTKLNFDEVKIDKYLVNFISDERHRPLILSIVEGLQKTKKQLVFEGVESHEQFEEIRKMDPSFLIQGWYTGKPLLPSDVEHFIKGCPRKIDHPRSNEQLNMVSK